MNETEDAKRYAERARRMRKIGFGVVVVILIILALVLGIYFGAFKRSN
jgi:t-SNARE complex subunit (syntaxin)